MRILFVHDRFGDFGGAEANIRDTARELRQRGHTLAIVHGADTGRAAEAWRRIFPECFALGQSPSDSAADALAAFEPDVIYAHNVSEPAVLGAIARAGVPRVRMVHDHQPFCLRGCKYPPWSRRACTRALSPFCVFPCGGTLARDRSGRWPFKWASYTEKKSALALTRDFDRVLVASGYMREELLRNGFDPARIEIHAPVPPPADALPPHSPATPARILYAGQLARGKGVDVLLEALALVSSPFVGVIAGDGHHRAYCEALSRKLGLADRVSFLGYVSPEQLAAHYRDSALAVVSSVWPEPFGLSGVEAMRHGLPVVAFDTGGIREWLLDGETGFVVPWMDRAAFAARVELLLHAPDLARQLGARARAVAAERFAFPRYVTGLESLFARLSCAPTRRVAA